MPTQLAATPVLKGEDAKAIIDELHHIPSEEERKRAEIGAKILKEMFEGKVKYD